MSTDQQITPVQLEESFQRTFSGKMNPEQYAENLRRVLEILQGGAGFTAKATLTPEGDQLAVSVTGNAEPTFNGTVDGVNDPSGGGSSGVVSTSATLDALFQNTTSFSYDNASFMVIYFKDGSNNVLGFYSGTAVSNANPGDAGGQGSWS